MNYLEARAFLKEKEALGSVYGLSVMRELLLRLGNPEKKLSVIHVAGTNGKGSTIAFTSAILREAGYRVGCSTSPAVFIYEEIIQVDGTYIEKEAVARLISRIREAAEEMVQDGFSHPTVFEMETAMAFCYFAERNCQLVCVECGLGGALDATNVIENPICTAFTSISRDHMGILGESLSEIGEAKARIIKPGACVVSVEQEEEVREILEHHAEEKGCKIRFCEDRKEEGKFSDKFSDKFSGAQEKEEERKSSGNQEREDGKCDTYFSYREYRKLKLGLPGLYQQKNAALALEIIEAVRVAGYGVTEEAVRAGLSHAVWPGRFQKAAERPDFYLDGAHNEGAAKELAESVKFYFTNRKICYIMGVFHDKEYEKILEIMAPNAEAVVTVTPPGKRGLDGEKLAESAKKWYRDDFFAPSYEDAIEAAKKKAGLDGVVLAFGSLSYLGDMARLLSEEKEK